MTASSECAVRMPTVPNIKRRIRHIKRQAKGYESLPKTDDFEIPERYLKTQKGDDFLFEDATVSETGKRFLVFATESRASVRHKMAESKEWFVEVHLKVVLKFLSSFHCAFAWTETWPFLSYTHSCPIKNSAHMQLFGRTLRIQHIFRRGFFPSILVPGIFSSGAFF